MGGAPPFLSIMLRDGDQRFGRWAADVNVLRGEKWGFVGLLPQNLPPPSLGRGVVVL